MSKKPKKSEYKASDLEKTNAAVAAAESRFFREHYQPLLTEMRDESLREGDQQRILKDRAQADTMQTLTRPSFAATQAVDYQSDLASAALGQQMQASAQAKDISTTMQTGVLGVARGQAADAQSGLAAAARLRTSKELALTQAKFKTRQAKSAMWAKIGGGMLGMLPAGDPGGLMGRNKGGTPGGAVAGGQAGYSGRIATAGSGVNSYGTSSAFGNMGQSGLKVGATGVGAAGGVAGGMGVAGWFSDIRLKENITYLGQSQGFNIYSWDWNDKAKELGINDPTTGVIAQEVQKTNPELVRTSTNGYLLVNYGAL